MKKTSKSFLMKLFLTCWLMMSCTCEIEAARLYLADLKQRQVPMIPASYIRLAHTWFDLKKLYNESKNSENQTQQVEEMTAYLKDCLIALKAHRINIIMLTMQTVYGETCFWTTLKESVRIYQRLITEIQPDVNLDFYQMPLRISGDSGLRLGAVVAMNRRLTYFEELIEGDKRYLRCEDSIYIMSSFGSDTPTSDFDYSILKENVIAKEVNYSVELSNITLISFFLEKVAHLLKINHCGGVDAETCLDSNGYPDIMVFYKTFFVNKQIENKEQTIDAYFTNTYSSKMLRICGIAQIHLQKATRFHVIDENMRINWQQSIDLCTDRFEKHLAYIAGKIEIGTLAQDFKLLDSINFMNLDRDDDNSDFNKLFNNRPQIMKRGDTSESYDLDEVFIYDHLDNPDIQNFGPEQLEEVTPVIELSSPYNPDNISMRAPITIPIELKPNYQLEVVEKSQSHISEDISIHRSTLSTVDSHSLNSQEVIPFGGVDMSSTKLSSSPKVERAVIPPYRIIVTEFKGFEDSSSFDNFDGHNSSEDSHQLMRIGVPTNIFTDEEPSNNSEVDQGSIPRFQTLIDGVRFFFTERSTDDVDNQFEDIINQISNKYSRKNFKRISKMLDFFDSKKKFIDCISKINYPQFFLKKMYTSNEKPAIIEFKETLLHSWDYTFFTQNHYTPSDNLPVNQMLLPFIGACHIWASEAYVTFGALDYVKREKQLMKTLTNDLINTEPLYLGGESLLETFIENFGMMIFHIGEEGCTDHEQDKFQDVIGNNQSISDAFSKYIRRAITALSMKAKNEINGLYYLLENRFEELKENLDPIYHLMFTFYDEINKIQLFENKRKKEQYFVIFKKYFSHLTLELLIAYAHGFFVAVFKIHVARIDFNDLLPIKV